jgi:hypothetical protein
LLSDAMLDGTAVGAGDESEDVAEDIVSEAGRE